MFGKTFILETIVCPVYVNLSILQRMDLCIKSGGRVIWDYQGLQREIPKEIVENAIQLAEDYASLTPAPNLDSTPKFALPLSWGQTIALPDKVSDKGGESTTSDGSSPK